MTSYSGEPISSQTANDAGAVAEVSASYIAHSAGEGLNSVPGGAVCPPGYKQTELGVIPESWIIRSIGDLCNYQNGKAQEKYFNSNDGYKVVSIGNYSESGRYVETGSYIEQRFKNEVGRFLLNRGDLAMILNDKTAVGTIIGRVLLIDADESYVMNQRTMRLTPKAHATSEYLHCLINSDSVHKRIVGMAKPGTQIYVNTDDVLNFNLPLPESEEEQTAIANALSDVDALIGELEKLIAKKQAIKTATMQQLLTGRTRLPQFALREDGTPKGTKSSELGEIPEDWEVHALGSLCGYQNGKAQEQYFNSNDGYKVISIGNYSESGRYIETGSYIDKQFKNEIGRFVLSRDDLTMILNDKTAVGTIIGRVLLIEADDTYVMNQRTMRLTPKDGVKSKYLHFLINSDLVHKRIVGMAKPGTQIYVNTDDVLEFNLPVPDSQDEQTAIATILSDMDAEIQALEQRLSKTRQIKQGMMQELLTGKTRLPIT